MDALDVHVPGFTTQHNRDPAAALTHPRLRDLAARCLKGPVAGTMV
jgi:hypothetical protein